LAGGDVRDGDVRTQLGEFKGEAPGPGSRDEYAIARSNEVGQVMPVEVEGHPRERRLLVTLPLLVAVPVEHTRDVLDVVLDLHIGQISSSFVSLLEMGAGGKETALDGRGSRA